MFAFESNSPLLQDDRSQVVTSGARLYSTTQDPRERGWDEAGDELVLMLMKEDYLSHKIDKKAVGVLRKRCQAEGKGTS
eukprot:8530537-Pyramimonas_sp.AAC.1